MMNNDVMEKDLQAIEDSYRRLFEEDLTGNFIMNPDGRIELCNPAFARIFGFDSPEEAMQANYFDFYPNPEAKRKLLELLERKKKLEFYEVEMRRPDGRKIFVVENIVGRFNGNSELVKIRGYLFDDSRRKETEFQLMQAQKLESLGMLAGSIAHDFNNFLSVINANCEIMLMRMGEEEPFRKFVVQIKKTGMQAAMLTQQIRAFSRKEEVEPYPLNINEEIDEIKELLRRLVGKEVELIIEFNYKIGKVKIDAIQLEQVIMNLAVNARDAMMPKGGTLTLKTDTVDMDENACAIHPELEPGRYIVLSAADTGSGMDNETQKRIFEPFFTTKEKNKGTGLGLSTVYGIIRQNSGTIELYSVLGKGTTFKIYLPEVE